MSLIVQRQGYTENCIRKDKQSLLRLGIKQMDESKSEMWEVRSHPSIHPQLKHHLRATFDFCKEEAKWF